jgi:hypothetical protein
MQWSLFATIKTPSYNLVPIFTEKAKILELKLTDGAHPSDGE